MVVVDGEVSSWKSAGVIMTSRLGFEMSTWASKRPGA